MKKRIQIAMILAAMICMSVSGCSERTVTPKSTSVTEPIVKTSVTSVTTVTTEASVTEVTEKFTIPSTVVETTESVTEVVAVTRLTAPQTETPKVNEEPTEYYEPIKTTIAIITGLKFPQKKVLSFKNNFERVVKTINDTNAIQIFEPLEPLKGLSFTPTAIQPQAPTNPRDILLGLLNN